jgi:hypothetical protein
LLSHSGAAKDFDLALIKLPPGFSIEKYGEVDSARTLLTTRYQGATITYVSTLEIFTTGGNSSGVSIGGNTPQQANPSPADSRPPFLYGQQAASSAACSKPINMTVSLQPLYHLRIVHTCQQFMQLAMD